MLGGPPSVDLLLDGEWLRVRAFSSEQGQQLLILDVRQNSLDLKKNKDS